MNNNPLISVLCSSFNHEKFVGYFINSLINQSYKNWELIIIDDCSTDNNISVISEYLSDKRIHFSKMDYNSGSSVVTTKAFNLSKGEIIVDCASDDALKEDYFQILVDSFISDENIGVIYSPLQIINENNTFKDIRPLPKLDRIGLLRELFYNKNILYSPGFAIRRDFYKLLLPMNFALVQHQDYQWHIKLLLNTDCKLLEQPYVYYRVQEFESLSLGTRNNAGNNRYSLETDFLMNTFLSIKDSKTVELICNNQYKDFPETIIPFVLGISSLSSKDIYKRQWGYKTLLRFFENPENLQLVHTLYNFQFKDFLKLSNNTFFIENIKSNHFNLITYFKYFIKKLLFKMKIYK